MFSDNLVLQKTNEVFINVAHWSVTFVHDLRPFQKLISKINSDLGHTDEIIRVITDSLSKVKFDRICRNI